MDHTPQIFKYSYNYIYNYIYNKCKIKKIRMWNIVFNEL